MEMIINLSKLIAEKNKRAWTQGHLAEVCGLSLRTIQRIEKTGVASHETIKALASVFEISVEDLFYQEPENTIKISKSTKEDKQNIDSTLGATEKPSKKGKVLAVIGTIFVMAFVVISSFYYYESSVSNGGEIGSIHPSISAKYSNGFMSFYYFSYSISFFTLLPGLLFLCFSIGLHKYNQVWSNRTLFFSSVLFILFNIK